MISVLIPQTDPKASYIAHKAEIDTAIAEVLESGWYILGQQVTAFEQEFAAYLGISAVISVANGTDALHLALRACGVGPGDTVITVAHTAVATVAAIELAGAIPFFVDIDPATFTLDPHLLTETLKNNSDQRFKALIPVHLYGHPAQLTAILELAKRYDLFVIEDCAQAHGATFQNKTVGTWGDIAAFSFYPTKNLGALGDGGAIATNNPHLAEKARLLREYGWQERYISTCAGTNSRLDELQAAVLRVKLRYLASENARRQEIAALYNVLLAETALNLPQSQADCSHVYHQYVIRSKQRDDLRAFLKANNVGTLIHYPVPIHFQPAYQNRIAIGDGGLGYTEQIAQEIVSLPIYPQLTNEQIQQIAILLQSFSMI
jgi:dTDP-4-amino-4,6-dideoxygalactose transaminase